ncbi:MAG: hypothetical protein ACR2PS_16445 [Pseudomonadales bacterium]
MITKLKVVTALLMTVVLYTPANAQDNKRNYEQGTVWTTGYIETKPGYFNAYMNNLEEQWLQFIKLQQKDGDVLSYKVLNVISPRDGEPDLILLVEWKNMAVFDRSAKYFEDLTKKVAGTLDKQVERNIDREELRKLRGGQIARELIFQVDQ